MIDEIEDVDYNVTNVEENINIMLKYDTVMNQFIITLVKESDNGSLKKK